MIIIQKHQEVYISTTKMNPNNNIADSESFKFKVKITGKIPEDENMLK